MRYGKVNAKDTTVHVLDNGVRAYCGKTAPVEVDMADVAGGSGQESLFGAADAASFGIASGELTVCRKCQTVKADRERAEASLDEAFMVCESARMAGRGERVDAGMFAVAPVAAAPEKNETAETAPEPEPEPEPYRESNGRAVHITSEAETAARAGGYVVARTVRSKDTLVIGYAVQRADDGRWDFIGLSGKTHTIGKGAVGLVTRWARTLSVTDREGPAPSETAVSTANGHQEQADTPEALPVVGVEANAALDVADVDTGVPWCPPGLHIVSLPSTRYRDWWGVECGRCQGGGRASLPGEYDVKGDAYAAASAHYEEKHRPADDALSVEELDEVDALSLSDAQHTVIRWAGDDMLHEFVDGFWGLDVVCDKWDVNKRVAKGRVTGLWAAGLLDVVGNGPGARRFRLSEEGRRVRRLIFRAKRQGMFSYAPRDVRLPALERRSGGYPLLSEGRYFKGEEQPEAEAPAYAPDVVSDPGTVEGWEGEGGACPDVAADRREADQVAAYVAAYVDEGRAVEVVPALGWSRQLMVVMDIAAGGGLYAEETGRFRAVGAVGRKGRLVKAERVALLMAAGFLAGNGGLITATKDGREALRMVRLAGGAGLHADDRAAFEARFAAARRADRRAGKEDCKGRARSLPVLPGGAEEARRRAAWHAEMDAWSVRLERMRAESDARIAAAEAEEEQARKAREARHAAELAPCTECAGVYPVEARCGKCREWNATGRTLVDDVSQAEAGAAPVVTDGQLGDRISRAQRAAAHGIGEQRARLASICKGNPAPAYSALPGGPVPAEEPEAGTDGALLAEERDVSAEAADLLAGLDAMLTAEADRWDALTLF
ncbi:hypothetical protein [Streptantibioticus ferralitis]|nr:hypothetical protein [Streptantibioticus ferralitis]